MKELAVDHSLINNANLASESRHFLEALTRWNYFPNQKESATELPPNITTRRLTPEIVQKLLEDGQVEKNRGLLGYDLVEYRATRYNNVSRVLGLLHPMALAKIFKIFSSNEKDIRNAISNINSAISVDRHNDGRMLIMNYESQESKVLTATQESFGKKFRAHTDIANCFGSVYTHSLEWATQGFLAAKENLAQKNKQPHWSSSLDKVLRSAKRSETSGLPIGPATSSIAVEIILSAVDCKLREKFSFIRYIDDYTALCDEHSDAEDFIRSLSKELSYYKLTLNLSKTSIIQLPMPLQENWVSSLTNALPPPLRDDGQINFMSTGEAFNFLDHAVRLNNETPDGSVLKFAASTVCRRVKDGTGSDVLHYLLNLAWHYPILLPYLEKIDVSSDFYDSADLVRKLNSIINTNSLQRRSDGICWSLYYIERLGSEPDKDSIQCIIESRDCVALAMLSRFPSAAPQVVDYANSLIDGNPYSIDENWFLFYELYRSGKIRNPYLKENTFPILKKYEVDFFCNPNEFSPAENYCTHVVSNPFVEENEKQKFDDWMVAK